MPETRQPTRPTVRPHPQPGCACQLCAASWQIPPGKAVYLVRAGKVGAVSRPACQRCGRRYANRWGCPLPAPATPPSVKAVAAALDAKPKRKAKPGWRGRTTVKNATGNHTRGTP